LQFILKFRRGLCYNSTMERRRSKRTSVNLRAERISGGRKDDVFIEDISETGIHLLTAPSSAFGKYHAGNEIDVRLALPLGESIVLKCRVVWSFRRMPPEREVDSVGLEIIGPPPRYLEFIRTFSSAAGV